MEKEKTINENFENVIKECNEIKDEVKAFIVLAVTDKETKEGHKKATAKAQIRSCDLEIINAQLKELLKEWLQFETEENPNDFTVMSERMSELANKTKEVLR